MNPRKAVKVSTIPKINDPVPWVCHDCGMIWKDGRPPAIINGGCNPLCCGTSPYHTQPNLQEVVADLRARLAEAERERANAELRHRSLSERHWTCMKCGGSWNCDRAPSAPVKGNHAPVCGCPYCERDALRAVVEKYACANHYGLQPMNADAGRYLQDANAAALAAKGGA